MKVLTYYAIIAVMVSILLSIAEKCKGLRFKSSVFFGKGNFVLVAACYLALAMIVLILI